MGASKEFLGLRESGLVSREPTERNLVLRRPAADVRATAVGLVASGASVAFTGRAPDGEAIKARASLAGPCERPVYVIHDGRPHRRELPGGDRPEVTMMTLETEVPCRQCPACLRFRMRTWGNNAVREWHASERTWFVTLTFEPQARYVIESRARHDLGVPSLGEVPRHDRFRALERVTGKMVTDYLKALRDGRRAAVRRRREKGQRRPFVVEPVKFRYLLTVEPHKDGFPHYHLLLHEQVDGGSFTGRGIESLWKHGFTAAELVKDQKQAFYAAKYLGKQSVARVRSSLRYGETGEGASQSSSGPGHDAPQAESSRASPYDTPRPDRPSNGAGRFPSSLPESGSSSDEGDPGPLETAT